MKLLSSWRRWEIYIFEENGKKYAIKKAKDYIKKWAIQKEITILKYLNWKVNFVPKILDYWDDWFKYEFIDWKELYKIKNDKKLTKKIYKNLINYAYDLDKIWVEHWELSRPTKNIIVNNTNVFIIDFERWNLMNKKFKNLKAIWQFLLSKKIILRNDLSIKDYDILKNILTKKIDLI